MKKYVGITVTMSALSYPRIGHVLAGKLSSPFYFHSNRFFTLRKFLHLVDNLDVAQEQHDADRLWKVRPLIDRFHAVVLTLPREVNMCIDEQMIPFSGAVAIRQYVPRKPYPIGIKILILAGSSGLVLDLEMYQGASTPLPAEA
jgi:hypothetical protein